MYEGHLCQNTNDTALKEKFCHCQFNGQPAETWKICFATDLQFAYQDLALLFKTVNYLELSLSLWLHHLQAYVLSRYTMPSGKKGRDRKCTGHRKRPVDTRLTQSKWMPCYLGECSTLFIRPLVYSKCLEYISPAQSGQFLKTWVWVRLGSDFKGIICYFSASKCLN